VKQKPPVLASALNLKVVKNTKAARVVKPKVVARVAKPAKSDASSVVVGIGASAGGLEAFSRLLAALPNNTGMAFVLVQHLDPNHESVLTELLARTTSLPVLEIKDGTSVQANTVYVIPPNTNLAIAGGVLQLSSRTAGRGQHRPIDDFLSSLAQDRGHRAIGVVLSGTASDGTLGLEAIKGEGGISFAQDEASAKFDSMPHSAVAAGVVDFVLPPEGIAAELVRLSHKAYLIETEAELQTVPKRKKASGSSVESEAAVKPEDESFKRILRLLHDARGVDFSLYRSTTIRRRIDRRMLLDNIASLSIYAKRLSTHPQELEVLYQDLLIGVTRFFRDPQAFDFLQRKVFPSLVKNRTASQDLRIWVSGCSTGQEAYSLAMTYLEFMGKEKIHVPLRVFATDLNEANLEKARAGYYPKTLTHDISKERLKRFFTEENGSYRIGKAVRDLVVFAHHNVFADPPFSRMDLISCRNLLIYLEPVLQTRVIPTFHYALKPKGVLLLGASETVGRHTDLFAPLDNRCRVYTKLPTSARILKPMLSLTASNAAKNQPEQANLVNAPKPDVQSEADRFMLARYAPAGVLINEQLEIVQFRGVTGDFLELPSGKASFQLLRMAREGLMLPLRALIERVKKENRALRTENVHFVHDDATQILNLEVVPLRQSGCLLVLFETPSTTEAVLKTVKQRRVVKTPSETDKEFQDLTQQMTNLKRELLETREYLEFMQEQGEAVNEELQSSNEEAQSANEEMQSLNEELETAKEELESSNEEMRTINDELNERNSELRLLNEDHLNFQASVELGIVTVGADLCVRRFTPQAEKTLGLRAGDIGQPIWQVRHSLEKVNLQALMTAVIASDNPSDLEVQDETGCWFLLRIRPYRTLEDRTNGAVLVLFGIDVLKRTELERQRLQHETELIFESLKDGLIALDHKWVVTYVNTTGAQLTRFSREEMLGRDFWELFPEAKDSVFENNYRKAIQERITIEFEAYYPVLETQFEISVVPVQAGITIFYRNVTDRYNSELVVAETREKLRVLAESQRRFLADAAHELRAPLAVIQGNLEVLERFPNMTAEERKDAINESAREAIRLGRLANDLLSLARGDAGDGLRLERLELVPILEETLREAEHLASGRSLEHLVLEPCTILGDADKLKQLTLILLDNALKYAPEGGRVWLELQHSDSHAEIRISNTGQGISHDDLKRVFERFYRTDTSRSRQTGGTGLGLSIARWIAEQHGGTVELQSEPGATTTAIVRLPLVQNVKG
jgi:two-component system, chemotaxis family, CheB/CheR fusion protein